MKQHRARLSRAFMGLAITGLSLPVRADDRAVRRAIDCVHARPVHRLGVTFGFKGPDDWARMPGGWKIQRTAVQAGELFRNDKPPRANESPKVSGEPSTARSPEMLRVAFLIGKWQGTARTRAPGAPDVPICRVNGEGHWVLHGRYLQWDEQFQAGQDPPRDRIWLLGYDAPSKAYRMWMFGSTDIAAAEWQGKFQGQRLVLNNDADLRACRESNQGDRLEL